MPVDFLRMRVELSRKDARRHHRVEQPAVQLHDSGVPGSLRDRPVMRGARDGPPGHAQSLRLRGSPRPVELRRDACRGLGGFAFTFGIALFILGNSLGEAANFPACIKTVAEWFPEEGARASPPASSIAGSNLGFMRCRKKKKLVVPLLYYNDWVGWRGALRRHRRFRIHLAHLLVVALTAGRRSIPVFRREELALIQSDPPDKESRAKWDGRASSPVRADLGLRRRQILHRPRLVVLSVLAAALCRRNVPSDPEQNQRAHPHGVCRFVLWQRGRRLAVFGADQARQEHQYGAQDHHADMRAGGDSGALRALRA